MHIPGAWILLGAIAIATALILLLLHRTRLGPILHEQIPDRSHRNLFLASVSFFVTFVLVRLLVLSITHDVGPFGYVMMGGRHIHHLVWGILLLLVTGYAQLAEVGQGDTPGSLFADRMLALGYGIGAALTLDEFALWLNLDAMAYWSRQGRESIDAVVLFGAALAMGTWGAPFFRRVLWGGKVVGPACPVKLEDVAEPERIFSTPVGEDVESRRKFIEDNALDVKNMDS
jgi:hypothetical protein